MPIRTNKQTNEYDPRWFIWTIVFLLVAGISLVSYIVLSDSGSNDVADFTTSRAVVQQRN